MKNAIRYTLSCLILIAGISLATGHVSAQSSGTQQSSGTTGLQGKVSSPPPTTPATISTPTSGRTYTTTPITVSGLCTTGMLVKIFSNNIFVGSVQCENGSYSIEVDLFGGSNELIARIYDALDQAGPDSNRVTVTFQDAQFAAFGERVSLTSNVAKLGAPVGSQLTWPILISGGTGPYAISVDWGDGSAADLKSVPFAGAFDLTHTYKSAGIYRVVVKATDSTGATAFLQLVGVGSGDASQSTTGNKTPDGAEAENTITVKEYVLWPLFLMVPMILATFWVGMKFELSSLHRQLEKQAKLYDNEIQR